MILKYLFNVAQSPKNKSCEAFLIGWRPIFFFITNKYSTWDFDMRFDSSGLRVAEATQLKWQVLLTIVGAVDL